MIPAESFGVVGCGRSHGGGALSVATFVARRATATAIVVIDLVQGERSDEVGKARDFRLERVYLCGELRDNSNSRYCYFDYLVRHICELGEFGCVV